MTYEALAKRWGLIVCDSHHGCKKRWPEYRHTVGAVDQYGYLHWSPIHSRMTRLGLRNFLKLVAYNRHDRAWARKPLWWRLWRSNVEAHLIARNELHINLRAEDSFRDRSRAQFLARYVPLRSRFPAAYDWIYWPMKKADEQRRRDAQAVTAVA